MPDGITAALTLCTQTEVVGELVPRRLKLKLRARRRVRWAEGTLDNEELNRKKSKCCCQYHRPRTHLDESSDESEDEEWDESDSGLTVTGGQAA